MAPEGLCRRREKLFKNRKYNTEYLLHNLMVAAKAGPLLLVPSNRRGVYCVLLYHFWNVTEGRTRVTRSVLVPRTVL